MSTNGLAISLFGLEKRYPGFTLGPLDLAIEPGTVVGLVGPNGAGKTTTLNCITGLVAADGGASEVFGRFNDPDDATWKRDVGYVGEEHGFYGRWTAEKNLRAIGRLQPGWSESRVRRLVERFELPLATKAADLSKGNRTKLALVAALGHGPRLLLLDEPTSGLDPVVRTEVLDVLWEVLEDGEAAILYSTHVLSDISRLADELVFLRDGQILQRSDTEALSEAWRRISFRLDDDVALAGTVRQQRVGTNHQAISSDHLSTVRQLRELGAENIEESRMSIDEIVVEILKGNRHVETR
ncbi:MAG: ABC transporter ATP-binding protein [bacterium]|nr:ABC transporter ATP-binding protein [bacterium]